jgi:hypothetical protein
MLNALNRYSYPSCWNVIGKVVWTNSRIRNHCVAVPWLYLRACLYIHVKANRSQMDFIKLLAAAPKEHSFPGPVSMLYFRSAFTKRRPVAFYNHRIYTSIFSDRWRVPTRRAYLPAFAGFLAGLWLRLCRVGFNFGASGFVRFLGL